MQTLGPRRQSVCTGRPLHVSGKKDLLAPWVENQRKSPITHWELRQLRKQDLIVGRFQRREALATWQPHLPLGTAWSADPVVARPRPAPCWHALLLGLQAGLGRLSLKLVELHACARVCLCTCSVSQ